jgi:hypothetical protein
MRDRTRAFRLTAEVLLFSTKAWLQCHRSTIAAVWGVALTRQTAQADQWSYAVKQVLEAGIAPARMVGATV